VPVIFVIYHLREIRNQSLSIVAFKKE